jgi:hypothetical protein
MTGPLAGRKCPSNQGKGFATAAREREQGLTDPPGDRRATFKDKEGLKYLMAPFFNSPRTLGSLGPLTGVHHRQAAILQPATLYFG